MNAVEPAARKDERGEGGPTLGEMGLERFAPYLMNRVMGRWNDEIRQMLRAHGLTTPQMRALAVLSVRPCRSVHELAVYTVTEPSTMSRTVDALEARGLATRDARPDDGRAREIAITPEGAAAFAEVWPHMRAGYERMLAGIGEDEREAFVATLAKIVRNLGRGAP